MNAAMVRELVKMRHEVVGGNDAAIVGHLNVAHRNAELSKCRLKQQFSTEDLASFMTAVTVWVLCVSEQQRRIDE